MASGSSGSRGSAIARAKRERASKSSASKRTPKIKNTTSKPRKKADTSFNFGANKSPF
jgi:hypothetical protein